jgi:glycolate oxidase
MIGGGDLQGLAEAIARIVGPEHVLTDPAALAPYGHDESGLEDRLPDLVALPGSTAEVSALMRLCTARRVPVTPSAGRSGKSGGSLPLEGGLALSLSRMNRVLAVHKEDLIGVAQPGVITADYMRAVEAQGLFYPPDPASLEWGTLGGNVAENAGGPRALKYGVTREYVLGLEVVLASGEVLRCGKRTIKGVAGLDLVGLLVGSEGTLAVITEITTKLLPLPQAVETALCLFEDDAAASRAVSAVLAAGILPRAMEFLDRTAVAASRVAKAPYRFPEGCGAAVLCEVDGNQQQSCAEELARLGEICLAEGAVDILYAANDAQRRDLWETRRAVSINLKALHPRKLSEDVVVPRSRIPEMVAKVSEVGRRLGLEVACYGHAGDGNLHANVLYDTESQRPLVERAVAEMLEAAVALGGTITGEHGVGLAKRDFLELEQGPGLIALQRQLKAVFDPLGLLNPGKIFPPLAGRR